MRLRTIWSLPSMTMAERFRRTGDWLAMTAAEKLPKRVRFWATMLELAKATNTSKHIPPSSLEEILKNLEGGPK